jgi:hypothetical protein
MLMVTDRVKYQIHVAPNTALRCQSSVFDRRTRSSKHLSWLDLRDKIRNTHRETS